MAATAGGGQGGATFSGFGHQQHGGDRSGRSRRGSAGRQIGVASSSSSRSAKTHQIDVHGGAGSEQATDGGTEQRPAGARRGSVFLTSRRASPAGVEADATARQRRAAATQRQTDGNRPPRQQIGATHPRGERARGSDGPPIFISAIHDPSLNLPTTPYQCFPNHPTSTGHQRNINIRAWELFSHGRRKGFGQRSGEKGLGQRASGSDGPAGQGGSGSPVGPGGPVIEV
ncbi:hypothetical protein ACLOJK_005962 [Asimina triloba]